MKIATNGARHWGSQIPRIEDGFRALGHEITLYWHEADLVYSQNDHAQVVADKLAGRLKRGAKVVLTCLDVPTHIPGFDVKSLATQLAAADAVCTISAFGQWQVKTLLDLDSTVVYQPIKGVKRDPAARQQPFYRFAHCGRRVDENKRASLGVAALQLLGYTAQDLCLVGNEPGWGDYLGVLSDQNLNVVYNSVDLVLCTSALEGLSLVPLEAMACGAVPVVCRDMTTRTELLPPDLFPEYDTVLPHPESLARFIASLVNDDSGTRLANLRQRLHDHYRTTWQERTSPAGVATRILQTYESTLTPAT